MKILVIADTHIYQGKPGFTKNNMDISLDESINALEFVLEHIDKNSIDILVFTGDGFRDNNPGQTELNIMYRFIHKAAAKVDSIYLVKGNHDIERNINDKCWIENTKWLSDNIIKVTSDPLTIEKNNLKISFVPYMAKDMAQTIRKLTPGDILFTHCFINGVKMPSGYSPEGSKFNPLNVEDFKNFKIVIVGDIHKRQKIANCYYPGSLTPKDRGETGKHGFIVLDTNDMKVKNIDVPCKTFESFDLGTITNFDKNTILKRVKIPDKNTTANFKYKVFDLETANAVKEYLLDNGIDVNIKYEILKSNKVRKLKGKNKVDKLRAWLNNAKIKNIDKHIEVYKSIMKEK